MSPDQRRSRIPGALSLMVLSSLLIYVLQLIHQPEMPLLIIFIGKSTWHYRTFVSFESVASHKTEKNYVVRPGTWWMKISVDIIVAGCQYIYFQELGAVFG